MSKNLPAWVENNILSVAPDLRDSTLYRFRINLPIVDGDGRQKSVEVNLLADLDLNWDSIEHDMLDFPSQYAFWSSVYSEARMAVSIADRKLKMRYGSVTERIHKEYADRAVKPTAEVIKRIIECDEQIARADIEYQKLQMQAGKLYHMLEALKAKIDIARSIASLKRHELERS